jgi:acetoin utilization protein AcuC
MGPGDTPAFKGMHDASMLVAAASREAARLVLEGEAIHAFNPGGGLHHAMPDRASGFCVYNDPAIAIDWMLEHGAERIAYVDIDVHHGDGVEVMFADEPRVLTISLHESGRFLFPGSGHTDFIGGPDARGHAANVPLLPGTDGPMWLETFDRVVPPLLESFKPDVLVTQLGADTHLEDPLAHLALRVDDQAAAVRRLHQLAHEVAEGRWVATGGGGYSLVRVVPRMWTAAFAEMCGQHLPDLVPESWQRLAASKQRGTPPTSFSDPEVEVDPAARGRALQAAREAAAAVKDLVLPHHW